MKSVGEGKKGRQTYEGIPGSRERVAGGARARRLGGDRKRWAKAGKRSNKADEISREGEDEMGKEKVILRNYYTSYVQAGMEKESRLLLITYEPRVSFSDISLDGKRNLI